LKNKKKKFSFYSTLKFFFPLNLSLNTSSGLKTGVQYSFIYLKILTLDLKGYILNTKKNLLLEKTEKKKNKKIILLTTQNIFFNVRFKIFNFRLILRF
jgi:hypothetical protein